MENDEQNAWSTLTEIADDNDADAHARAHAAGMLLLWSALNSIAKATSGDDAEQGDSIEVSGATW